MDDKSLKTVVAKLLLFASPALLLLVMSVVADPFRIYREYEDYHEGNFVFLNREYVCLKVYDRNSRQHPYDSFILGNSRSQAFKVRSWERYLPRGSRGYHFDSAGGGIYGIYNRIKYIDRTGGRLAHVLIVVDQYSLTETRNSHGHLFVSPPELSDESSFGFYSEFTKPLLNLKFVIGYIDYSLSGSRKDYMRGFFADLKYPDFTDARTNDVYYGADKVIWEDPQGYYQEQFAKGVFYDRSARPGLVKGATEEEAELLLKIRSYLHKHKSNYHIVICPMYDQVPLGEDHLRLLVEIFGHERVHDYSGRNSITESVHNYYEESHFRPHVADQIMRDIYLKRRIHPIYVEVDSANTVRLTGSR